jgi:hypothetical protein
VKFPRHGSRRVTVGGGLAIGIGVGAALGVAIGKLAVGIAIGVALGLALGAGTRGRGSVPPDVKDDTAT